jgi:hypothetical protein
MSQFLPVSGRKCDIKVRAQVSSRFAISTK